MDKAEMRDAKDKGAASIIDLYNLLISLYAYRGLPLKSLPKYVHQKLAQVKRNAGTIKTKCPDCGHSFDRAIGLKLVWQVLVAVYETIVHGGK